MTMLIATLVFVIGASVLNFYTCKRLDETRRALEATTAALTRLHEEQLVRQIDAVTRSVEEMNADQARRRSI